MGGDGFFNRCDNFRSGAERKPVARSLGGEETKIVTADARGQRYIRLGPWFSNSIRINLPAPREVHMRLLNSMRLLVFSVLVPLAGTAFADKIDLFPI